MKECTLHTSGLAIGFRGRRKKTTTLLSDINLQLFSGEITCLLGQNGAGKSTLLRTFSGVHPPLQGSVFINGKTLSSFSFSSLARLVSVVLTEKVELGNFSVLSVVALGRSPYTGFLGTVSVNDNRIIDQAIENAGISHLRNRNFDELSDGEKQKVMIAKSLAQETPLILLDEPTAFLDFPSKAETLLLLRDAAWNHGKTILLTTHDLNLALGFADKIWLIAKDKPIRTGTPEDLVLQGFFADFFDKENTRFDTSTGTFTFEPPKNAEVAVEGEGLMCEWLKKALNRKGFSIIDVNRDVQAQMKIRILEAEMGIFQVIMGGEIIVSDNIGGVLEILEKSKKKDN
jgi:iron complex transport system ATP-binding protein